MTASLVIRDITPADAPVVAALHAASWRTAYRGILSDAYLNDALDADRLATWTTRLADRETSQFGVLALDGDVPVGFGFVFRDADPRWGHLLDNLHVTTARRSAGIGPRLMAAIAERLPRGSRLHLWVYDGNVRARAFYDRMGGRPVEQQTMEPPGGGQAVQWRYVWDDIDVLRGVARD